MKAIKQINGYTLTRLWFDFCFENSRKTRPIHGILFLWIVEKANRLGWMDEFQLPSDEAAAACGAADRETILKAIADLEQWGFIKVIRQAKNRYIARWIKITAIDLVTDLAGNLDLALELQPKKPDAKNLDTEEIGCYSDAIPDATPTNSKPLNEEKPINNNTNSFNAFWESYDYKKGKKYCQLLWKKLPEADKASIMDYVPSYVNSTPNKQYRLKPENFLKKRGWEDELIQPGNSGSYKQDLSKQEYNTTITETI